MGWGDVTATCGPRLAPEESATELMPHVVQQDETLEGLQIRFGFDSLAELRRFNPCLPADPRNLQKGALISVPRVGGENGVIVWRSGKRPSQVARELGVDPKDFIAANWEKYKKDGRFHVGDLLWLPAQRRAKGDLVASRAQPSVESSAPSADEALIEAKPAKQLAPAEVVAEHAANDDAAVPAPAVISTPSTRSPLSLSGILSWANESHFLPTRSRSQALTGNSFGAQLMLSHPWIANAKVDESLIFKGFVPDADDPNYLVTGVSTIYLPLTLGPRFQSGLTGYAGVEVADGMWGHRLIGGYTFQLGISGATAFNLSVSGENNMAWADRRESWLTGVLQPTLTHQAGPLTLTAGLTGRIDFNFANTSDTVASLALLLGAEITTSFGNYGLFLGQNLQGTTREPGPGNESDILGQTPGNQRLSAVAKWQRNF